MSPEEELQIYRTFFHQINVHCITMNNEKIREAVGLIDSWSYAHRRGNGEYTEEEQQECVNNVIRRMRDFC
jgi:hypothetical protein